MLYRWTLKPGREAQFVEAWSQVTAALLERGSLGSRLHQGPDGLWVGYAQWPDALARERAFAAPAGTSAHTPAFARMREAIAESFDEIELAPVADYLVLPRAAG